MNKKIGFIGCGNMARAMIAGLLDSNIAVPDSILASNSTSGKLEAARKDFGIGITSDNKAVARFADILILSVKPNKYTEVIREIRNDVKKEAVIVTIAAGIKIKTVEAYFGKELKIVRAMPNIPAVVGEAMTALCCNGQVTEEELKSVYDIFSSFGLAEILDEELLDVVTAVSASSPALVYMFIEALTDGAVLKGLSRDKAYRMVSQAVLGAAKMVLVTGKHPGQLKDSVCSAGGTAIEAVYSLEKKGFRGHVIEAIQRCTEKAESLGIEINGKAEK
ncbi:MAG TPA: pyrroline-5-carboxylate reductase [Bacillota bacterium]|jgi:pyrroline-5-carboxylate reductase|nr:pyrroline-5-carboxylate reductase [Bacillota bacterium]HRS20384.1 pyrroline-5-carboxylate reductase [Clostridia bacterium]HRU40436.1 pyrroline-5-carboxylate reductase [Candidatus Diapherotrites archaeon]HOS69129.1 pyrroline-5-carboxylate reductase [Bacillota bacterium]HQI15503.1 pyrroline-5-carboxylate reductase [Bacillota bacterium]